MKSRCKSSTAIRTSIATALFLCATASMAQWQWLDDSGRKVYSDRPPPASVPAKNIIKRPGHNPAPVIIMPIDSKESAPAASQPAVPASAATPKPSASEQKAAAEQKKKEAEEARLKKAEEEKAAKARAENCQRAKTALATLKTGVRVSTVNAKGETQIMNDQSRAAEEKRLNSVIASECAAK